MSPTRRMSTPDRAHPVGDGDPDEAERQTGGEREERDGRRPRRGHGRGQALESARPRRWTRRARPRRPAPVHPGACPASATALDASSPARRVRARSGGRNGQTNKRSSRASGPAAISGMASPGGTWHTDPMISSDSHIVEPPDLWERWLPSGVPGAARPKLVKDDEGGDAWLYNDGGAPAPLGPGHRDPRPRARRAPLVAARATRRSTRATSRRRRASTRCSRTAWSPRSSTRRSAPCATSCTAPRTTSTWPACRAYNDWLAKDFCAKAPGAPDRHRADAGDRRRGRRSPRCGARRTGAARRARSRRGRAATRTSPRSTTRSSPRPRELGMPISLHIGLSARAKVAPKPKHAGRGEGMARGDGHRRPPGVDALRRRASTPCRCCSARSS